MELKIIFVSRVVNYQGILSILELKLSSPHRLMSFASFEYAVAGFLHTVSV